jgi:hypothetical protein
MTGPSRPPGGPLVARPGHLAADANPAGRAGGGSAGGGSAGRAGCPWSLPGVAGLLGQDGRRTFQEVAQCAAFGGGESVGESAL